MKINKMALFLMIISIIFCGIGYVQPCSAESGDSRYACQNDVRKDIEKANRIVRHGLNTKQITPREADGIRHNINRVENDLSRALSDGRLNPRECDRLQQETRGLYRHIRSEMNDDDRQGQGGRSCQNDVRKDIEKADRIVRHGLNTRQITPREADGIRHNINRVENDLSRALSDGRLNPRECDRLQQETRGLYRHIKHEMNDDDDRQGQGGWACQHEVREDIEKARANVSEGFNTQQISPQEAVVISKKIDELENDYKRSVSDRRLNPRECDRLKLRIKEIYDLIGYARNN